MTDLLGASEAVVAFLSSTTSVAVGGPTSQSERENITEEVIAIRSDNVTPPATITRVVDEDLEGEETDFSRRLTDTTPGGQPESQPLSGPVLSLIAEDLSVSETVLPRIVEGIDPLACVPAVTARTTGCDALQAAPTYQAYEPLRVRTQAQELQHVCTWARLKRCDGLLAQPSDVESVVLYVFDLQASACDQHIPLATCDLLPSDVMYDSLQTDWRRDCIGYNFRHRALDLTELTDNGGGRYSLEYVIVFRDGDRMTIENIVAVSWQRYRKAGDRES